MAVPKKRTSSSRSKKRRSHLSIKSINVILDKDGKIRLPHRMSKDGIYNGRQVLTPKQAKQEQ